MRERRNNMDWIKYRYYFYRAKWALDEIERLEKHRDFISPFFCGETAYPIKLAEWHEDIKKAKDNYKKFDKKFKRLAH